MIKLEEKAENEASKLDHNRKKIMVGNNLNMNTFPETVIDASIDLITNQSSIPNSPAIMDKQGNVNLCLAGVIAKAGLLVIGEYERIPSFEKTLLKTSSKKRLEEEFIYLGWCPKLCRKQILINDNTPSNIRKDSILKHLNDLKNT
ncbi:MAG: hypothetical protein GVY17_00055 [Cyanobacteria bacterium]|nr:hypothetical protein [Cyanobacteria bacterium GSL.Bin21]